MVRPEAPSLDQPIVSCPSAQRKFTDREEPQNIFLQSLASIRPQSSNVLGFYGVGGIGKTRLQQHLKTAHLDTDKNCLYSSLDFEIRHNRSPHQALRLLMHGFKRQKFKIAFHAFELAYLIYWEKEFPDQELKKASLPFLEEGGLVSDAVGVANDAGGVVSTVLSIIEYFFKKNKEISFDKNLKVNLQALNNLTPEEIEKQLARYFAYDIQKYSEKNPEKKIVIFLDTHEALWADSGRKQSNCLTQDGWLRDGLINAVKGVLFVICGREKIIWQEDDNSWEDDLTQHLLGDLSDADARDFLQSCGIHTVAIQDKIIADSEGVPYYLDLSVDTYYQIRQSKKTPNAEDFKAVGKNKLFDHFMKYLNINEAETLKVLSNARFYTLELMQQLIETFKTAYPATDAALKQLNDFSFIREEEGIYQIHDLMRSSLRDAQTKDDKQKVNVFLFEYYDSHLQDLTVTTIGDASLQALPEAFYYKQQIGDIEALIGWYKVLYKLFYDAAKYTDLQEVTENLSEKIEQTLGEHHIETGYQLHRLSYLYKAQGKYEEAEPLYQRSLAIMEKAPGKNHSSVATILNNLALLYDAQGKYEEAEPLYQRSLSIKEKVLGKDHSLVADTLNNLAALYYAQGKYEEAEPLYQRCLLIKEKALGKDHPEVAMTLNNLAALYKAQGKYEEAKSLYQRSLSITEKALGKDHPEVANTLNNLAELYREQDQYEEAEPLYQRSLSIKKKTLGEDHTLVAATLNNLALLYDAQGKYEEAELLYQRCLLIMEKALGKDHPSVATTLNNLAGLYRQQGKYEKAEPLYQRDLSITEKALGKDHPLVAATLNNLAFLYDAQGKYKEAVPLFQRVITIMEKAFPNGHPNLDATRSSLAILKNKMG